MIRDLPPNVVASADYRTASPDYFRAMGIRLLQGRGLEEADREDRPLVAVISASAAQRFWPNRNPIGRAIGRMAAGRSIAAQAGH